MADRAASTAPQASEFNTEDGRCYFLVPPPPPVWDMQPPAPGGIPPDVVDEASRDIQRQEFLRVFEAQMDDLRNDPEAWADYWTEAELTLVTDDID